MTRHNTYCYPFCCVLMNLIFQPVQVHIPRPRARVQATFWFKLFVRHHYRPARITMVKRKLNRKDSTDAVNIETANMMVICVRGPYTTVIAATVTAAATC